MKANELRVGNLVFVDTYTELERVPMRIESILYNALCKEYYSMVVKHIKYGFNFSYYPYVSQMKPIPLSEEILLKCGFKKIPKNLYVDDIRDLRTAVTYQNGVITWNEDTSMVWVGNIALDNIKYLHQLQNLFFAITGEELKVEHRVVK